MELTISTLIPLLQKILAKEGDMPVIISDGEDWCGRPQEHNLDDEYDIVIENQGDGGNKSLLLR